MSKENAETLLQLIRRFPAAADYLSTILLLKRDYGEVHNSALAARLGVSKPAVTQTVARLKKLGLIEQNSYGLIDLLEKGRILAEKVLVRHYLVEHLLVHKAEYPWDKADDEAGRLQTLISQDLADHLFELFNKPEVCPHGNPFPGSAIEKDLLGAPKLTKLSEGTVTSVLRITEEGEGVDGLLGYCYNELIQPGMKFRVTKVAAEKFVQIEKSQFEVLDIPWNFALHICVRG